MFLKKRRKKTRSSQEASKVSLHSNYIILTKENIIWFSLFIFCCAVIGWLLFGNAFSLTTVNCIRDKQSCDEQIIAEIDKRIGSSLLRISPSQLEKKLMDADPTINSAVVTMTLPHQIDVVLESKFQHLALTAPDSQEAYIIDSERKIIGKEAITHLPLQLIISPHGNELEVGERIQNPEILKTIEIMELLNKSYINAESLTQEEDRVTANLHNGILVFFSYNKDVLDQVTSLQQILSQATIKTNPETIDVRFDKPVVKYRGGSQ